jgi:hypothetical protein
MFDAQVVDLQASDFQKGPKVALVKIYPILKSTICA